MRRFLTVTEFYPLRYNEGKICEVFNSDGTKKEFKTRKAVEAYCKKNNCMYMEAKRICYR